MNTQHAYMAAMIVVLRAPVMAGQGTASLTGVWRVDPSRNEGVMGPRGESVASPINAQELPRTAPTAPLGQDLSITEKSDTVDVPVAIANRLTLPLSGLVITSLDASGMPMTAQAQKEGAALVIRRTHAVRLPGGATVLIDVVERYTLTSDNELVVEVTRTTGGRSQRTRTMYTRVP